MARGRRPVRQKNNVKSDDDKLAWPGCQNTRHRNMDVSPAARAHYLGLSPRLSMPIREHGNACVCGNPNEFIMAMSWYFLLLKLNWQIAQFTTDILDSMVHKCDGISEIKFNSVIIIRAIWENDKGWQPYIGPRTYSYRFNSLLIARGFGSSRRPIIVC